MLWFTTLLVVVVIAAGASIAASRDSRTDVASGHPAFESVADLTGIWDRERLDELIGPRDDDDRYNLDTQATAQLPRTWWKRWFDSDLIDAGCIVTSIAAAVLLACSYSVAAWCMLIAAATYIAAGYIGGLALYMRSRT